MTLQNDWHQKIAILVDFWSHFLQRSATDLDYRSAEFMAAQEQAGTLCVMRYCQLIKQNISNDIFKIKINVNKCIIETYS